eukprot:4607073-Amphidinium_carterae.1
MPKTFYRAVICGSSQNVYSKGSGTCEYSKEHKTAATSSWHMPIPLRHCVPRLHTRSHLFAGSRA